MFCRKEREFHETRLVGNDKMEVRLQDVRGEAGKCKSCDQVELPQRRKKLGKEKKWLLARCRAYVNPEEGQCFYV